MIFAPASVSPATSRNPDLPALFGLRFFAAVLILVHHLLLGPVSRQGAFVPFLSQLGLLGMTFFFVLSGFLIHYLNAGTLFRTRSLRSFLAARLARLYPLYLCVLLIVIAFTQDLAKYSQSDALKGLLPTVLMAQSWFFETIDSVPVTIFLPRFSLAWSISTELLMYAAYPFVLLALRRLGLSVRWQMIGSLIAIPVLAVAYQLAWTSMPMIVDAAEGYFHDPATASAFAA